MQQLLHQPEVLNWPVIAVIGIMGSARAAIPDHAQLCAAAE